METQQGEALCIALHLSSLSQDIITLHRQESSRQRTLAERTSYYTQSWAETLKAKWVDHNTKINKPLVNLPWCYQRDKGVVKLWHTDPDQIHLLAFFHESFNFWFNLFPHASKFMEDT